MTVPELCLQPPSNADNLFDDPLPIVFLKGMTLLHTLVTANLDIVDLVYFSYRNDLTM